MPKQIVNTGGTINYRYFGGARSVKILSSTDIEYYIAGMVIKQTGVVKSYQTANGYAVPNSNGSSVDYFYNVKDWLGTNRAVISATGQMVNALDMDPYGKKLPGRQVFASNYEGYRYQFTGHETDGETGYQYHGARYYAEELGRYMGVDPLAMKFANWSTYNYTMSNPIMMTDPSGMGPQGWGGTEKTENGVKTVSWTYSESITADNYKSKGYTEYMEEGWRDNFTGFESGAAPAYFTAGGDVVAGKNLPEFEVNSSSGTISNPSPRTDLYVQDANPWKRSPLMTSFDFGGTGSGNIYSGGMGRPGGPPTGAERLAKYMMYGLAAIVCAPAIIELGVFAAPAVQSGVVTTGVGLYKGGKMIYDGAKTGYTYSYKGLSYYHNTFGKTGGYLNIGTNYVTQSISNGSMNPLDHNVIEYGVSAFIGEAKIQNQCIIGGTGGLVNWTPNAQVPFKHLFNRNIGVTLGNVVNGGLTPLYNLAGPVPGYLMGNSQQAVGGYFLNKLEGK